MDICILRLLLLLYVVTHTRGLFVVVSGGIVITADWSVQGLCLAHTLFLSIIVDVVDSWDRLYPSCTTTTWRVVHKCHRFRVEQGVLSSFGIDEASRLCMAVLVQRRLVENTRGRSVSFSPYQPPLSQQLLLFVVVTLRLLPGTWYVFDRKLKKVLPFFARGPLPQNHLLLQ